MKKVFLITTVLIFTKLVKAQTVFTVGNTAISKAEFMQNFNRNSNNIKGDKKAALKENLDLFIKYKLKVQAAYDAKLDTLQNQKEDAINFRKQIEQKYLTEDKMMKLLTQEAFQRMQQDVRISHIIVMIDKSGDTTLAFKKIMEAYKKLQAGAKFEDVVTLISEDPNATTSKGDIGYITAFNLPYNLETLAYNTPLNQYSKIYKSSFAYHIFKRTAQRTPLGRMKAQQILVQVQPTFNEEQKSAAKQVSEELYTRMQKGEIMENLARAYSNDMYSASAGGMLQEFGVGKYDQIFENTYASLKNGEMSKPFLTSYGWHILKRIENTVPPKVLDATTETEIFAKINNDSRKARAEELFVKSILKQIGYKPGLVNKAVLLSDTELKKNNAKAEVNTKETEILHSFNNTNNVTVGDFWKFVADAQVSQTYKKYTTPQLLDAYVTATGKEFYKQNLENYNPEFKAQIKEFKDGNLLFEIMERNVWNNSANDEAGLKKYYETNKNKYTWTASAEALIFNSNNLSALQAVNDALQKGATNWQDVLHKNETNVRADSGRYEYSSIPVAEKTRFVENLKTTIFSPNKDGNYVFAFILKTYNEGELKSYDDAKGLVINDFQLKTEEEWIANLRKKYNVKVNEAVWKSILANAK